MNEENLISPIIFFKPGQCPYCSGVLMVVDSETTCMILGDDGEPIKEDTMIRIEAACQNCGKQFPMMRYGFGYRPESLSKILFDKYDKKHGLSKSFLSHTEVAENPFVENETIEIIHF